MTEAVHELLDKSERSINAANLLLGDGYYDFAASRAYYAMFYAVEALMLDRDLSFSKHSAVIAAFGKHFVKTGIFDSQFHRSLLNAFDLRNAGDYLEHRSFIFDMKILFMTLFKVVRREGVAH